MSTFIDGVNRLLRINTIIRGDDDDITTFSDTQHSSDISLAQIAIQSELTEIISDRLIPYEKTNSTISLVATTRTYALQTNFIRFFGSVPSFYDSTQNVRYYEYQGGEDRLMNFDYAYKTTPGAPYNWYWDNTTVKQVALYPVPTASGTWAYEYEKSVMVTNSSDTIPFHNVEEFYTFIDMAARRFRFLITKQPVGELTKDATYTNAKARLYALLSPTNPNMRYGSKYG